MAKNVGFCTIFTITRDDIPAIRKMLQAVEIDKDIPVVICIQIVLEYFRLVP